MKKQKTRKELLEDVRILFRSAETEPMKLSEEQSFDLFADYFDPNSSIFDSYTLDNVCHFLLSSELIDDTEIFMLIVLNMDGETITAELDFDDRHSLQSYLLSCSFNQLL